MHKFITLLCLITMPYSLMLATDIPENEEKIEITAEENEEDKDLVASRECRHRSDNERPTMYDRRRDRQLERDAVFPGYQCCPPPVLPCENQQQTGTYPQ